MDASAGHARERPSDGISDRTPRVMSMQSSARGITQSRSDDSWVEVSSRPSSSSLSSAAEEIVTDGLRIQHDSNTTRRRRASNRTHPAALHMATRAISTGGGSSQEEYDESESESDKAMASSNEALQQVPGWPRQLQSSMSSDNNLGDGEEEEDDDDEIGTAINVARASEPVFQPQPNAFNWPQSSHSQRPPALRRQTQVPFASSSRPGPRTSQQQHRSFSGGETVQHSPFNIISPSYQADQDAALRASLSTLLSAAAARGKSMSSNAATQSSAPVFTPTGLRLVPESEILGVPRPAVSSSPSNERGRSPDKTKRPSSRDRRTTKKARRNPATGGFAGTHAGSSNHNSNNNAYGLSSYSIDDISPTFLTWVVSAGVVVLVGALSFSAGYVVGRETGREEAAAGLTAAGRCGGEVVVRGGDLRRLRWSDGLGLAV